MLVVARYILKLLFANILKDRIQLAVHVLLNPPRHAKAAGLGKRL